MLAHPFRTIGLVLGLLVAGIVGWGVTVGGYRLDDPELEEQLDWVRAFKADHPELTREIGPACGREIGRSPWTRDGAFALFSCIRRKGEERGITYVFDEAPAAEDEGF